MKELIGFWLISLAIVIFCVSIFADEMTIKEKVIFAVMTMVVFTILMIGLFLMVGSGV